MEKDWKRLPKNRNNSVLKSIDGFKIITVTKH